MQRFIEASRARKGQPGGDLRDQLTPGAAGSGRYHGRCGALG
jgi:hypothetical protein